MQIKAFIQVINYLKGISGNEPYLNCYRELIDTLKEASDNSNGDRSAIISEKKNALRKSITDADPSEWGYGMYSIFELINAKGLFGKPAAEFLDGLLAEKKNNYEAIAIELGKTLKQITKFSENLNKLSNLFGQMVPAGFFSRDEKKSSESSISLYFEGHLSVQSISDMERYSRLWDSIINTFCRLTGEQNQSLDIADFNDGNVVLEVAAGEKTLEALMSGVNSILSSFPGILKIRKIQQDISVLTLENDLHGILNDEIEAIISRKATTAAQELVLIFNGSPHEVEQIIPDLTRSLKQILSFIERGGKIEYHPSPQVSSGMQINKALTESFNIVRELEKISAAL